MISLTIKAVHSVITVTLTARAVNSCWKFSINTFIKIEIVN